jgi:hypothetical protein
LPLIDALSYARYKTYLEWSGGDQTLAFRLYDYNIRLSAALYGPLHMLEVALRNAVDRQMQRAYGASWLSGAGVGLTRYQRDSIAKAEQSIRRQGKGIVHDPIVAELNLGFWTSFFGKSSYLQWQHLRRMFSVSRLQRAAVADMLDKIRDLRNRIAHHEPILRLPLDTRYASIRDLVEWIEADAATWIDQNSTWSAVFLGHPTLEVDSVTRKESVRTDVRLALL